MKPSIVRIATRKSALALWQAEHVAALLRGEVSGLAVTLVPMTTRGDEVLDRPLSTIGGKGAVPEGTGSGHARRPRRPGRPFAEGRAGQSGSGIRAAGDPAARRRRRCVCQQPLRDAGRAARGRPRRHLVIATAGAVARAASGCGSRWTCAAMSAPDWPSSTPAHYAAIVLACAGLERLGLAARIRSRLAAPALAAGARPGGHCH